MFRVDPKQAALSHISAGDGAGTLGPEAEAAARIPAERGLSHKIVGGFAQLVEAALLFALGMAIYAVYLDGANPAIYVSLSLGIVIAANVAFNIGRTHRLSAYRSGIKQL